MISICIVLIDNRCVLFFNFFTGTVDFYFWWITYLHFFSPYISVIAQCKESTYSVLTHSHTHTRVCAHEYISYVCILHDVPEYKIQAVSGVGGGRGHIIYLSYILMHNILCISYSCTCGEKITSTFPGFETKQILIAALRTSNDCAAYERARATWTNASGQPSAVTVVTSSRSFPNKTNAALPPPETDCRTETVEIYQDSGVRVNVKSGGLL